MALHYAAEQGASLDVMKLLLNANPEADAAADKARSSAHIPCRPRCGRSCVCSCFSPFVLFPVDPQHPMLAPRASYAQDGRLPLHHAAVKGAPFDVMKLLLDANREAATAADKVRR